VRLLVSEQYIDYIMHGATINVNFTSFVVSLSFRRASLAAPRILSTCLSRIRRAHNIHSNRDFNLHPPAVMSKSFPVFVRHGNYQNLLQNIERTL